MKSKPRLGQHFLIDERGQRNIVDALGDVSDRAVVEIGPGHGAITSILAQRCRRLIAIELDPGLAAELRFHFRGQPQVEVLEADILTTGLTGLIEPISAPRETAVGEGIDIVGNLPYYITSDILLHLFATARGRSGSAWPSPIGRAVLMMQREVAERLAASPGTREYGLLSVTTQLHARVESLFTLPPEAFSPPPEVFSTVLRLDFAPRFAELQVEPVAFDRFLKQCFAQKRKTLANNLRAAGYEPKALEAVWPEEIPVMARGESLGLEALAALFRALATQA